MGLRKVTPSLPKGNLLPESLLSPLEYFWPTAHERSQKNYFCIKEMSFYFYSPHIGKNTLFLSKFSETFSFSTGWAWCISPLIFTTEKPATQFKPLAWAPSAAIRYSQSEVPSPLEEVAKRKGRVPPALCCMVDDSSAGEMSLTQTTRIRNDCKAERFWWLKWWPSAVAMLLTLHSE